MRIRGGWVSMTRRALRSPMGRPVEGACRSRPPPAWWWAQESAIRLPSLLQGARQCGGPAAGPRARARPPRCHRSAGPHCSGTPAAGWRTPGPHCAWGWPPSQAARRCV